MKYAKPIGCKVMPPGVGLYRDGTPWYAAICACHWTSKRNLETPEEALAFADLHVKRMHILAYDKVVP